MFQNKIIAEVGSVHDGSFGNALKLIEVAKNSGADIVKFQTHIAEYETTLDAPSPAYFNNESRFEYFKRTSFGKEQWRDISQICSEQGVGFLSSPFSIEAVEMLEIVGVQGYKIASGEVTNIPMLKVIAETNKPVILSSGMSNWKEIEAAVSILRSKNSAVTLMQCSSKYPCPAEYVGLNVLSEIRRRFSDLGVGFSDHYDGIAAGIAASALGANCIEKHITFSRHMYGSDAPLAMEPEEFLIYSNSIKEVWKMLVHRVDKNVLDQYSDMRHIFQKSIYAKRNLPANHILSIEDISFKKPADGILASEYESVIGKSLLDNLYEGEVIKSENISKS